MFTNRILERAKNLIGKETIWLIPILILACLLTFYPHLDYPYLLHVDEWFHVARAKQIVLSSDIDWYGGEIFTLGMERAWHFFLAGFYFLFRPTITQWALLPTILHLSAIFPVFYFVSKLYSKKEALITSFLVALLPSNVTMGGTVFLIPVNLGLFFIPLALVFAFKMMKIRQIYNYIFLFITTTFLLYAHPPTAIVLLIILGFYTLLNVFSKKDECKKHGKFLLFSVLLSVLVSIPNYLTELQTKGLGSVSFDFWVYLKEIPYVYGFIPTFFFILGFYFKSKSNDKKTWSLLLASIFLILNIVIFARLGFNFLLPYQRTFVPLFLLMSIIAAVGYTKVLEIERPFKKIGVVLLIILLFSTAVISINKNLNTSYYKIIDDKDYENFLRIKNNTTTDDCVICDPWKARALAPVAERVVYAVMPFGPNEDYLSLVNKANIFLNDNCINTSFLVENNISVVYARGYNVNNPDLYKVEEDIYFLKNEFKK